MKRINIKFQLNCELNSQKRKKNSFILFILFISHYLCKIKSMKLPLLQVRLVTKYPWKLFRIWQHTRSHKYKLKHVCIDTFTVSVIVYVRVLIRIPLLLFHVYTLTTNVVFMKGVIVCKSNFLSFFVFSLDELKHKNDVEFICVKVRMQYHSREE